MKVCSHGLLALLCAIFIFSACDKETEEIISNNNNNDAEFPADSLRLNQVQVIGSHNSYRLRTYEPIFNLVQSLGSILPSSLDPNDWDYTHLPLDQQFSDYGIRQIELDIYYDPDGGRFYNRGGNQLVSEPVESGIPELNEPGFKLLHVVDLDYMTNYFTLKQALQTVKNWSDAHPSHLPIFILIEAKETSIADLIPLLTWTDVQNFDLNAMNDIDAEIKDVFGDNLDGVVTPDYVRGSFATLNEAVTNRGWPKIAEVRGKVVFLLNNSGNIANLYLQGHPSLQGRIMFTNASAGDDDAAFIQEDNPFSTNIETLVSQGYIIRTRADGNTDAARTGDITGRERAFASGAQLISTDYYRPDSRYLTLPSEWTDYSVRFENNAVARLNPVNGPNAFKGGPIE